MHILNFTRSVDTQTLKLCSPLDCLIVNYMHRPNMLTFITLVVVVVVIVVVYRPRRVLNNNRLGVTFICNDYTITLCYKKLAAFVEICFPSVYFECIFLLFIFVLKIDSAVQILCSKIKPKYHHLECNHVSK